MPTEDLIALNRLYRIIRKERFTIVHCHTPKAEFLGQIAARLAGVPVIADTFRGIYYRKGMHPLWRRIFLRMAKIAASCADVIFCQSREMMNMAIREGICPAPKTRHIGNGIDVHLFDDRRFRRPELVEKRSRLAIPQEAKIVGFVGRLVGKKGYWT